MIESSNNCEYFVVNKSYDCNYRVVLVYFILEGNIVMALRSAANSNQGISISTYSDNMIVKDFTKKNFPKISGLKKI